MHLIVWASLLLLVPVQAFAQPKASNQIPVREAVPTSEIFRTKPYLQRPIDLQQYAASFSFKWFDPGRNV